MNGTFGQAKYVSQMIPNATNKGILSANPNYNLWVANTPSDTEAFGLTYQQRHFEVGIFDKRVGDMWNDLSLASGATANQIIPIAPFSVTNLYFNYVLANGSHFREDKVAVELEQFVRQSQHCGRDSGVQHDGRIYARGSGSVDATSGAQHRRNHHRGLLAARAVVERQYGSRSKLPSGRLQ